MKKEKIKPNGRKRIVVIATFLVVAMFLFSIFVTMFNNVSASPSVVKPIIETPEMDDFEDDTVGNPPAEPFYAYSGDYVVDNRTIPVTGGTINMFRSGKSLNLSGQAGNSSEFHFNESDYFSIDFYLAYWVEGGGTLRFKFQNATCDSFEIDYISIFNASLYNNAMDLNNDGHVNSFDIYHIILVYGTTGTPGWIKDDLKPDGVINYIDIAVFISNYVCTDKVDVRYKANITVYNITYDYDELLYTFVPTLSQGADEITMLHSYFQFSKDSLGYVGFKYAFADVLWSDDVMLQPPVWTCASSCFVGQCDWDRINISSETDTEAYLDDLTICYTPYDLAVHSVSPINTGIAPGSGATVNLVTSYYMIGNTYMTPMFMDACAYVYSPISFTWVPTRYFPNHDYITNNATITDYLSIDFSTTYYWYMNITTFGGGFGTSYSWEFPQTGTAPPGLISPTTQGDKFCNRFQTSAYPEPYVSAWTPAHNAVNVPLNYTGFGGLVDVYVTTQSQCGDTGTVRWYYLNNVTHVWVHDGDRSYYDGQNVTHQLSGINYNADVYWRVEITDDDIHSGWNEYPNATQSGVFLYGYKAWKFHTEVNTPPYVASYGPVHGSHFNPFLDTIYINMTDNQTDFTFNLFFLQNVLWGNGSYSDELSFIIEDSELVSSPYTIYDTVNGTMNFTWTPSDTANLGYINPMNGTNFSWAVQMDDGVSTSEYPASGRSFATPSNSEIGDWWVNYTSDWLLGNSLPTISVTYPVHAHTYTATQWKNNHNLRVTVIDAEGDDIYLSLSIKSGNGAYSKLFPLQEDYNYFDTMYSDGPIANGAYDFDLSYFVPFDNMNYSYYLTAEDSAHPRGYWNQLNSNFVIGTPPGATNHLSLMSVYPGNGVVDGFSAINNGLTGYYSYYSYSALDADKNHVAFFFSDGVQKETGAGIGYKYNPLLFTYGGKLQYLDDYPWNKFSIKTGLQSRHEYILHIGLLEEITDVIDIGLFGMGPISNFQEFGTGTFELDMLYDDTMVETEFKAELLNLQGTNYIAEPPYRTFELGVEAGEFRFFGASARFSTYPLGSGPNLPGGTWGVNLVRPLSDAGIGFGGLILTLLIVAIFTIIPYYFIRKKAKNVPMPIIFSFGFFGFLLSFGLGFLDLWMFVIPFVIMLFIIIFKALAWIRTGKTEAGVK